MIKNQVVIWVRTCMGGWSQCVFKMLVSIYQLTHHNTENSVNCLAW